MRREVVDFYRRIYRHIVRLPVDVTTLEQIKTISRNEFRTPLKKAEFRYSSIDDRKYNEHFTLLRKILVNEEYDTLNDVYNLVYKREKISWMEELRRTRYIAFRPFWPVVHLFLQLQISDKHKKKYQNLLEKDKDKDFSLMSFFNIAPDEVQCDIDRLGGSDGSSVNEAESLVKQIRKFHDFLKKNQEKLTHLKIHPFELELPSNSFGLPLHASRRDRLLKEKINYCKQLCENFIPIDQKGLAHLIKVAIHKPGAQSTDVGPYSINKNFFKYMERKRRKEQDMYLNPRVIANRSKKVIPSDNDIRKGIREYVRHQFYYDSGNYFMSKMQNFYENEREIAPYISL
ncbi:Piso0_003045 [Millerozyma farinosa CBS 7064]|uniref:Genetic interactor of prohibitin 5, mitochondrial n=1 Tax=Pichia sorbitophila (strain ATCC MYA-4447 / BCRC 22081 / CBS 7064 / NBRC 10061 / NRRL Y-12695) TaxID=559304 RepID=G8YH15_PICSO|nr:Piso0_003045 [Millerozyma farinosa CBS 7064]CCE80717.1 Piso0_003045 [Millerozyma farinosa CBS 7064]